MSLSESIRKGARQSGMKLIDSSAVSGTYTVPVCNQIFCFFSNKDFATPAILHVYIRYEACGFFSKLLLQDNLATKAKFTGLSKRLVIYRSCCIL